jgi:hypothetical protein
VLRSIRTQVPAVLVCMDPLSYILAVADWSGFVRLCQALKG